MEDLLKYVIDEAIVLVPALWIIGSFLKMTPKVPDWTIPWGLLALGITGSIAIIGVTAEAIVQGILVSGVAVLGHQLIKQTTEKRG